MKKDVIGYEGLYQIDDTGKVYSKTTGKEVCWEIYNTSGRKYVYPVVVLEKDTKQLRWVIHHLVADHFIPNPKHKKVVHHYDRNPMNNNVTNLRRCTKAEHATYHCLGDEADEYFAKLV